MKRVLGTMITALFLVWSAAAQSSASAQTSGSAAASAQAGHTQASGSAAASNDTSATTGQSGTQANSSTAASGAASASHSEQDKSGKGRQQQSGKPEQGSASAGLAGGSTLNAVLSHPVDSRKAKAGDQVTATTTQDVKSSGQVVIPKHSRLVGHVTEASAKANGDSSSSLGVVFDKAVLKNGQEVPVHALIQAMAASESSLTAAQAAPEMQPMQPMGAPMESSAARGNGGLVGSTAGAATGAVGATANAAGNVAGGAGNMAGSTVGATAGAAGNAAAGVAGTGARAATDASGHLLANSQGVTGLPGLTLQSAASSATEGSVVTSSGKNVHLDSGTQMLLRVVSQ